MLDTAQLMENLGLALVFVEGLMSFLSPCVLPLVPVYIGYLSSHHESRKKTIVFTLCFIFGIMTSLFLLNASMGVLTQFLKIYQNYFVLLGGVLIVVMGLLQLDVIQIPFLQRTYRMQPFGLRHINMISAFAMGFAFAFAWTPCIGPALASILLLAGSAESFLTSNLYMLVYAAGLCIPFLLVGFFTDSLLSWFKKQGNLMTLAMKIGGIILLCFGGYMVYRGFDGLQAAQQNQPTAQSQSASKDEDALSEEEKVQQAIQALYAYKVRDVQGNEVSLQNLKGKTIFVNFWATWCPPCVSEMGELQQLYDKYQYSTDTAVITISMPDSKQSEADIRTFMQENQYTMPAWIDDGFFSTQFGITSLPTSYVIQSDGMPYGYVSGALSLDMMENMLTQVKNAEKAGTQ